MPTLNPELLDDLVVLAERLADAAAAAAMPHFRSQALIADDKSEDTTFDPVTAADRGAETAIREVLADERPDDGILGEEQAGKLGTSGLTWVIDPIDGTRSFISGLPLWGILIALDDGTRGRIGVIDQPHIGERFVGHLSDSGGSASLVHRGERVAIKTRPCAELSTATLFTTDPYLFNEDEKPAFEALRNDARLTRFGADCYAYALLAMGQIDLVVETRLKPYDIAALIPLIQGAGGVVSDWRGGDCRWGGNVVAAGDKRLHEQVLARLATIVEH